MVMNFPVVSVCCLILVIQDRYFLCSAGLVHGSSDLCSSQPAVEIVPCSIFSVLYSTPPCENSLGKRMYINQTAKIDREGALQISCFGNSGSKSCLQSVESFILTCLGSVYLGSHKAEMTAYVTRMHSLERCWCVSNFKDGRIERSYLDLEFKDKTNKTQSLDYTGFANFTNITYPEQQKAKGQKQSKDYGNSHYTVILVIFSILIVMSVGLNVIQYIMAKDKTKESVARSTTEEDEDGSESPDNEPKKKYFRNRPKSSVAIGS